jgi:hypothetical protein
MHALAGERVQVNGQRRDQRLAFAGLHFGNRAFVQHHAAEQLHVEMALAEGALSGFAHGGEGGDEKVVEGGACGDLLAEFLGAPAQFFVAELLKLGLERIDRIDQRIIRL